MRIIVTKTEAYKLNELTHSAREKVLEKLWDINVDHEWWDCTYKDAKNIGLDVQEFDLNRRQICEGKFIESARECAEQIIKEHGDKCETYTTAAAFLKSRDEIVDTTERDENGDFANEWELDKKLDEIEAEFLHDILEDYRIILQKEYEYLTSEAAIIETIEANDYEFTGDGRLI